MYNPSRHLSEETRTKIRQLGISLDNYVANIESKLLQRGEYDLAQKVLQEIDLSLSHIKLLSGKRRAFNALCDSHGYTDIDDVPDDVAQNYL